MQKYIWSNKLWHFLCLLLIISNLHASETSKAGTLSGRVKFADGTPADMATVSIKGTQLHTYTDEKGYFTISGISPSGKTMTVEVRAFNSQPVTMEVDFSKGHQKIIVTLKAQEGIALGEVTVISNSGSKRMREKGFAVETIDTQKAATQNIQTLELLNRAAGVKIRQSAGLGSDVSFNLNGLSGNSVRIFIDGIPLRNYGRSFSLSSIPPSMIERIEVYKGVLPAELAEDALGGGINVVLKKSSRNALTTSYSYGSFNTHQWDLNGNYNNKHSGITANISSFYSYTDNNYKVWGENVYITNHKFDKEYVTAERFHDSYRTYGVKGNVGLTARKWADEFLLGFMVSDTKKDIQNGATMQVVYGNRNTKYNSKLGSIQFRKNNILTKGLDASTFTTYSHTNRQVTDTVATKYNWMGISKKSDGSTYQSLEGAEAGRPTLATNYEKNISNRSNLHYHIRDNHTVAINYFLDAFTRKTDDPMLSNEERMAMDTRRYNKQVVGLSYDGVFLQNRLKAGVFYKHYSQMTGLTEVSLRYSPNKTKEYILTKHDHTVKNDGYGITLAYTITPHIQLLASTEKAVRLPGVTELLGNTSEGVDANVTIKPESSQNWNIGFNFGTFRWNAHELSADVNLFVRDVRDMIQRGVPRNSDDFFRFENLGKISSKGFDIELRHSWNKQLFINANLSYFDARFNLKNDPVTGLQYGHYKSRLRNAPYFTGNLNAEYIIDNAFARNARLALNYNFGYTHEFLRDWEAYGSANRATIPTQALHDLGATYTFPNKRITFSVNAKNIFDTQVFDNFALQKPGRSIFGKITYKIF